MQFGENDMKVKHYTKMTVFFVMIIPIIAVSLVLGCVTSLLIAAGAVLCGLYEVLRIVSFRFEMWAKSCPRGSFHNCPWKTTLWHEFTETVKHYHR